MISTKKKKKTKSCMHLSVRCKRVYYNSEAITTSTTEEYKKKHK